MATKKGQRRRTARRAYYPKRRRSYAKKRDIHVVPDALAIGAVGDVLFESNTIQTVKSGDYSTAVNYIIQNLTSWNGLKNPVILGTGAIIARYAGKKLGLDKIGTKKVKLF